MQPIFKDLNIFYNKQAADYESQSAGVTRKVGQQVLSLLPPITSSSIIHDNACGPGIITVEIVAQFTKADIKPPTIFATDFNKGMVDVLQGMIDANNLKSVTAQEMDGSDLSAFENDKFTHSITNFGIFAFPDAVAGVKHIHRTLKPGGVAAVTTWKRPGNIFFINEVLQELAPGREEWFPIRKWIEEATLRDVLVQGGFAKGQIEIVERGTVWNIDDIEGAVELFNSPFWDQAKAGLNEEQKAGWTDAVRELLKAREGKGIDMVAWVAVARN